VAVQIQANVYVKGYVYKHTDFGFYPHVYSATLLAYDTTFSILLFYHLGHILYIIYFYHILTHCIDPVVIMSFNLFYSTQGVLHTNSFICYTTYSISISSNSDRSKKLPDDGRLVPKHVGASI
jgi:hypothetical protein